MEEFLTIEELAEMLKVSRQTLAKMIDEGLPFVYVGKSKRFAFSLVSRWLEERSGDKYEE